MLVLVVAAMACLVAFVVWLSPEFPALPSTPRDLHDRQAVESRAGVHSRPREPGVTKETSEHCVFVHGDANEPIADAILCRSPSSARDVDPSALVVVGRSDAEGVLRHSQTTEVAQGEQWTVRKHGYITSMALNEHRLLRRSVLLQRSEPLNIQVVSEGTQRPIEDVCVLVSVASLPGGLSALAEAKSSIPGHDPNLAIHKQWTDQQGVVTMHGLAPGTLMLMVHHGDHVWIDGPDASRFTHPQGGVLRVTMSPILACVARVDGDRVLASSTRTSGGLVAGGRRGWRVSASRSTLARRFEAADLVGAWVAARFGMSLPATVDFSVLLAQRGWQTLQVPLRSLADIREPDVIDVSRIVVDGSMGEVLITVECGKEPCGSLPELYAVSKHVQPEDLVAKAVRIRPGAIARLPAGEYSIGSFHAVLSKFLDHQAVMSIHPGTDNGPHVVRLRSPVYRYRLDVMAASGARCSRGTVTIAHEGRQIMKSLQELDGVWLPQGFVRVGVQVSGVGSGMVECHVSGEAAGERAIEIALVPK